jgi:hypothetical protein
MLYVGECAHLRDGRLMRVDKLVEDFNSDDWGDGSRYHV